MADRLVVDAETLRGLAGGAQALGAEIASLGEPAIDVSPDAMGDANLARALSAFEDRWRTRSAQLGGELLDAADFLRTFADTTEQTDAAIAGGVD